MCSIEYTLWQTIAALLKEFSLLYNIELSKIYILVYTNYLKVGWLRLFVSCIVVLVLASFVAYADFEVTITPIKDRISADEFAQFTVTIKNTDAAKNVYRIRAMNPDVYDWIIRTEPQINPIIVAVPGRGEQSVDIYIKPITKKTGEQGSKFVRMEAVSESTGEAKQFNAKIGLVAPGSPAGYVPTVVIKTDFPQQINPSRPFSFVITLANQNKLNITGAKLFITSEIVTEEYVLNILPDEKKTIIVEKELDPRLEPATSMIKIELQYEGKIVPGSLTKDYDIIAYANLTEQRAEKKGFFTREQRYRYTNIGNVEYVGVIKLPRSKLISPFTSTSPKSLIEKGPNGGFYTWNVALQPDETIEIQVKQNYIGIALAVLLAIIVTALIYANRSPLTLRKEASETENGEGGLSRLKVILTVRNRSDKTIQDIGVIDKIPKLLQVEKYIMLGSLRPTRVTTNANHDTLILWDMEELMPGEERIIAYYLKSNLNIVGGVTLQNAMAKFRYRGKEYKPRSNRLVVKQ